MKEVDTDDEWKHTPEPKPAPLKALTRSQIQSSINREYAEGKIER